MKPEKYINKKIIFNSILVLASFVLIFVFFVFIWFYGYSPYKKALSAIESQNYTKAKKIMTISSKLYPFSPKWYSLRGYARFNLKDYEGAISDYDIAYNLADDEYKTMNFDNKIAVLYHIKDYEAAIQNFDEEIEKSEDEFIKDSFLWDKAQFLYNIGKYEQALKMYDNLLISADQDKIYLLKNRLYYERAQVYNAMGRTLESKSDMVQAKKMNLDATFENGIPKPTLIFDDMDEMK